MNIFIVFDIGGSKTRVGVVRNGELGDVEIFDTPENPQDGLELLVKTATHVAKGDTVVAVCGDVSGVEKNGILLKGPNLPEWDGTNIRTHLEEFFNAPVTLFNDAELVALGEYYYGAGNGEKTFAYITVSTGVGSALVVEGEVDEDGAFNYELGHQLVRGEELESQVSGTAVKEKYNTEPKDFTDHLALEEMAEILGEALYNTTLAWSPDTIVLGGSMITGQNAIPFDSIVERVNELVTTIYPHAPRIEKAQLSKLGGLYGGMAYLERHGLDQRQ